MGLEFLARVRGTTLWLGGVCALMIATYVAPRAGLGLTAGAAWSLANLYLIERVVVLLTGPGRAEVRSRIRVALGFFALPLLFLAGWALLTALPATWLMAGFLMPFAVMVMKAVAGLMLSRLIQTGKLMPGAPVAALGLSLAVVLFRTGRKAA